MLLNVAADSEVGFAHAVSVLVGAIFFLRDVHAELLFELHCRASACGSGEKGVIMTQ
eukprot:m.154250 g.154250  ORF g.154250 m.154250 type:complete len:57 (+) comp23494_c0_seq2:4079-4249(+)